MVLKVDNSLKHPTTRNCKVIKDKREVLLIGNNDFDIDLLCCGRLFSFVFTARCLTKNEVQYLKKYIDIEGELIDINNKRLLYKNDIK